MKIIQIFENCSNLIEIPESYTKDENFMKIVDNLI